MRPSFLDDLSAAQTGPCASRRNRRPSHSSRAGGRASVIIHEMSRRYVLEHPVDDPDDDDDDDFDEDDEDGDEDDDQGDDVEQETWQVSDLRPLR